MRHLDLFSGIGGFAYAAQQVFDDHNVVAFCDNDLFCQKVLKKHWPDVPIISDIRDCTYERILANTNPEPEQTETNKWRKQEPHNRNKIRGVFNSSGKGTKQYGTTTIDLLTGGFPCQPYSVAGKQGGASDDRALFPELLRVIQEVRPTWIILENVPGIIKMGLNSMLSDLENSGYWNYRDKQGRKRIAPFLIPACGQDAPHRRFRVWIAAHQQFVGRATGTEQNLRSQKSKSKGSKPEHICKDIPRTEDVAYTGDARLQGSKETGNTRSNGKEPRYKLIGGCDKRRGTIWIPEPNVGRVAHGVPNRVDRLKCLGNAIVPQVAQEIMRCIKAASN
jgi:DNA (cytosine-5)-methyltransferase 1